MTDQNKNGGSGLHSFVSIKSDQIYSLLLTKTEKASAEGERDMLRRLII